MRTRVHIRLLAQALAVLPGVVILFAFSVRADEIVALTDERGRKVYINLGEPPRQAVDWVSQRFHPAGPSPTKPEIDHLVKETANRLQVDPDLIHAVIQVESAYNSQAVSRKGAMGLMQLIPATAARFGVENAFDPKQNIEGGASYLRYLLNMFGGDLHLSLAAYNAGENSVLRNRGIPAFRETRDYVKKVTNLYRPGTPWKSTPEKPMSAAPIYRYVDAYGIVHYTNVE